MLLRAVTDESSDAVSGLYVCSGAGYVCLLYSWFEPSANLLKSGLKRILVCRVGNAQREPDNEIRTPPNTTQ